MPPMDMLFLLGLGCLFAHELDAIQQEEWRFFFGWLSLSDEAAYRLFTAAHVPLFVLILWALPLRSFQLGMDIFLVIHALLHILLRNHPAIRFDSWFSRLWIFGGAGLGAAHLLLVTLL